MVNEEKIVMEIVKRALAEARATEISPKELETAYADEVMHSFSPVTLGALAARAGRMDPPIPDVMSVPVYFRSEGYHMEAHSVLYIEPPPESGKKPYFLISL